MPKALALHIAGSPLGVMAIAILAIGCAHGQRIDDGVLVSGVHGSSIRAGSGVEKLAADETTVVYDAQGIPVSVQAWPEWRNKVSFYHWSDSENAPSGAVVPPAEYDKPPGENCGLHAQLSVSKKVEYDGHVSLDAQIDVTKLSAADRAHVPLSFRIVMTNLTCGNTRKIVLVDSLPAGFTPTAVSVEDFSAPPAWEVLVLIPTVIGWIGPLVTWHHATTEFDDIAWDVKQVDGQTVLLVSADTRSHPLGLGDHIDLRVSGNAAVPGAHP